MARGTDAFSLTSLDNFCRPTPSRHAPSATDQPQGGRAVLPHQRSGVHRIFHPRGAPPSVRAHIIDVERNTAGDPLQEVLRLHDALRRLFPDLRFGSERDDGNAAMSSPFHPLVR